jgi:tagatose-6-phosphate ketose/aldose isomerase
MAELGRDESDMEALGALWTAREIAQQPAMLRKTHAGLVAVADALEGLLRPLLERRGTRVILTGAGTSAFIGECLAPHLSAKLRCRVDAIATTDIVSAPRLYLEATSTLLVSFARSGNSPESVAAVDLADRFVSEVHHLAVTCNPNGALARKFQNAGNGITIVLPEETHDRSFAMTSSFSCMMYAALAVFSGVRNMAARIDRLAEAAQTVIVTQADAMRRLAAARFDRVVYLGSHVFKGLARESALKMLELTDGGIIAAYDSPLGFRHGPKTIVNGRTLIVIFLSNDGYTRRYDLDLLDEILRERKHGGLLAISAGEEGISAGVECVLLPAMANAEDADLLFPFIAAPQMFAFESSILRGLSPDKPNTSGTVNRVVQGVRIHTLR